MAAPYDEDCATTDVAVDDRIAAVNEYVEYDRQFQQYAREIKERQERAEKARIQRDRARQRLLTLMGVERPASDEAELVAEKQRRYQLMNG